jgi:hypothetical protein
VVKTAKRCTCARSWGLHSQDCALYAPGHELAASGSEPTALICQRCGDEDGPFARNRPGVFLCEGCIGVPSGGAA